MSQFYNKITHLKWAATTTLKVKETWKPKYKKIKRIIITQSPKTDTLFIMLP